MITFLNDNTGVVTALATVALLVVTGWYAATTHALLKEAEKTRLMSGEPRVVAYLRAHEVHANIVQFCIANLSKAAAVEVSASLEKVTSWPVRFDFGSTRILKDLSYLRPNEILKFDLGMGPELIKDKESAVFEVLIRYRSLDGRDFSFRKNLDVASIASSGGYRVYGIDDAVRQLQNISKILSDYQGFSRLKVDVYGANDRALEQVERARLRQEFKDQQDATPNNSPNFF